MQYWIVYSGGVGGDGFSNLLEHADNVVPADGNLTWRIDDSCQERVKFYGPKWTNDPIPFRFSNVGLDRTWIHPAYLDIVNNNLNTVIPTHYAYFKDIDRSPLKPILTKNQVLVHLYSTNFERVRSDFLIKNKENPATVNPHMEAMIQLQMNSSAYHCQIDIERAWTQWNYLSKILDDLGIKLQKTYYDQYLAMIGK